MTSISLKGILIGASSCILVIVFALATPYGNKIQALFDKNTTKEADSALTIPADTSNGVTPNSSESKIGSGYTTTQAIENAGSSANPSPTSSNNGSTNNVSSTPSVSLTIKDRSLPESAGTVEVKALLSQSPGSQVTVPYTVTGTATPGVDHTASDGKLVFPAHVTSASMTLSIIDDSLVESNETIVITLNNPSGATLGAVSSQTITILDNDINPNPPCSRLNEDNSTWINAGIQQAIADGKSEYYIPACTYNLDNIIYVPPGTKNFKLYGAGADKTIFVTPNTYLSTQAIQIGLPVLLHNDWGLANRTNWSIADPKEGATTLTLQGGQAAFPSTAKRFVIWSRQSVCHSQAPDVCNHYASEIVTVTGYNSSTNTVTLSGGIGRDYLTTDSEPVKLALIDDQISSNIEVSDMGFDGVLANGNGGSWGFVQASMTDGLKMHDLSAINFDGWAINALLDIHAQMWNLKANDATATGAGAGYGITVQKSRFVEVWDSESSKSRHSFITHSGSMDVNFHDILFNAGFDTHGYDSKRITLTNCQDGSDSLNIGNGAWNLGDEVSITNCHLTEGGFFGYGLQNLRTNNVSFDGRVEILNVPDSATTRVINPAIFTNTTFTSTDWTAIMFTGTGRYEKLSFIDCTFKQSAGNTSWSLLSLRPLYSDESIPGNFEFIRMKMISQNSDAHLEVGSRTADFNLTVADSVFSGPSDMHSIAIGLESYSEGAATITGNTLYSTSNYFYSNSGPTVITESGNTILPPQ